VQSSKNRIMQKSWPPHNCTSTAQGLSAPEKHLQNSC
jgi:hypothetical protein